MCNGNWRNVYIMKKKSALGIINIILAVFVVVAVVVAGVMIATDSGPAFVQETSGEEDSAAGGDTAQIDALVPGTYGGVDFQSIEDVVNYYVQALSLIHI